MFLKSKNLVVFTNKTPNSKADSLIITKTHREDLFELSQEEWNDMLPIIKETINVINRVYQPIGWNLSIIAGDTSIPHFHMHVVPKYKKNYGHYWVRREELMSKNKIDWQEAADRLGAKNGVVNETTKCIASLAIYGEDLSKVHVIIKPKKSIPNDIQAIDQETWNQMGELILATIHQMKEKFNWGKELVALRINTALGKMTGIEEEDFSEFQIHIAPRFELIDYFSGGKEEKTGRKIKWISEYKRIAEKLKDPEKTPLERKQKKYQVIARKGLWKQPLPYLMFGAGFILASLGFLVHFWRRKAK